MQGKELQGALYLAMYALFAQEKKTRLALTLLGIFGVAAHGAVDDGVMGSGLS